MIRKFLTRGARRGDDLQVCGSQSVPEPLLNNIVKNVHLHRLYHGTKRESTCPQTGNITVESIDDDIDELLRDVGRHPRPSVQDLKVERDESASTATNGELQPHLCRPQLF
jgi:hypothetical protein